VAVLTLLAVLTGLTLRAGVAVLTGRGPFSRCRGLVGLCGGLLLLLTREIEVFGHVGSRSRWGSVLAVLDVVHSSSRNTTHPARSRLREHPRHSDAIVTVDLSGYSLEECGPADRPGPEALPR
jgi:hypothetical protein